MTQNRTPGSMPILGRGKHRSPRKGACFMELASYLAGERWSDHPRCTHPLLAELARDVNDHVSDATRSQLAPLIPDVIGLNGDDPRAHAWIAREAALTALPIASAERQGVAAAGLLRCEAHLARLEGRPGGYVSPEVSAALDMVPHARAWAEGFDAGLRSPIDTFVPRSAPAIIRTSVRATACACVPDTDALLVDLLARTIRSCQEWFATEPSRVPDEDWAAICALTTR